MENRLSRLSGNFWTKWIRRLCG